MKSMKFYLALLLFSQSILFSQNGWFQQNSGTLRSLNDCFFINDQTGFVGGNNGIILKTTNGGINWYASFNQSNYDVLSLYFISNTGWAVVKDNLERDSFYVFRTINNGIAWNRYNLDSIRTFDWIAEIQFVNSTTGYLTACGKFFKSTNSGVSWLGTSGLSFGIGLYFIDNLGWACKSPYGLYKTSNGGNNWETLAPLAPNQYGADIIFLNSQTGFCISNSFGWDGSLFKTINGGINWAYDGSPNYLYKSIDFAGNNTGYILAKNVSGYYRDKLAKTTNNGLNWNFYNIDVKQQLTKLFFSSVNTGWIVGDSGTIMKTTNGGVTIGIEPISTEIPANFSLSQNYPNPFNPATNINFQLPKSNHVKLSVYDLLGREVEVLVNEELSPGEYKVDFDGANYPSGIYYYKLQTGDFTETKKMILVK